jgi:hypothetical protein
MAGSMPTSSDSSTCMQWMHQSNSNLGSKSKAAGWNKYSDVENIIIEEGYMANNTEVILDGYRVDLKRNLHMSNNDTVKKRPVKRVVLSRYNICLREERYKTNPICPKHYFGDGHIRISIFILEIKKYLTLEDTDLSLCDETIVFMVVEKAAIGIMEEGKEAGKKCEAEWMVKQLMERKKNGIKEVWDCCARLYSKESFLYTKVNEAMRWIGSEEHEKTWRSKLSTFGPYCLLLWTYPYNDKPTEKVKTLYRGIKLSPAEIDSLEGDCSQDPKPQLSFQAFTSCSRNRAVAEKFGNVLLIIKVNCALSTDLVPYSEYPSEEEELIFPAVYFTVEHVEFDKVQNKYMIYLNLKQANNSKSTLLQYIYFHILSRRAVKHIFYLFQTQVSIKKHFKNFRTL